MNKLCYIEACTSEFDAPNLAEDMLGSNKKKKKNSAKTNKKKEKDNKKESPVKQEQDNTKKEEKTEILHRDEIKSDFKHLEYETVVHKSFENEEEITE